MVVLLEKDTAVPRSLASESQWQLILNSDPSLLFELKLPPRQWNLFFQILTGDYCYVVDLTGGIITVPVTRMTVSISVHWKVQISAGPQAPCRGSTRLRHSGRLRFEPRTPGCCPLEALSAGQVLQACCMPATTAREGRASLVQVISIESITISDPAARMTWRFGLARANSDSELDKSVLTRPGGTLG